MNWIGLINDICKLLADALVAFGAISFGVAVYENNDIGIFVGFYALFIAIMLSSVRRIK